MPLASKSIIKRVFFSSVDLNISLGVQLNNGMEIWVPINWFPRLSHGTTKERANWQIIERGLGIHWPDLDEDISLQGLLNGNKSSENKESLKKWIAKRKKK